MVKIERVSERALSAWNAIVSTSAVRVAVRAISRSAPWSSSQRNAKSATAADETRDHGAAPQQRRDNTFGATARWASEYAGLPWLVREGSWMPLVRVFRRRDPVASAR